MLTDDLIVIFFSTKVFVSVKKSDKKMDKKSIIHRETKRALSTSPSTAAAAAATAENGEAACQGASGQSSVLVLVFCVTKKKTVQVADLLNAGGIKAGCLR